MDSAVVELILKAKDEMTGPVDRIGRSFEGLRGHIARIKDIALGNLLGGLGVQGIDGAIRGVLDFGKSLITTNADIEVMRQRLNVLYQSAAEGAQAFQFLKQNELTKPFNIQDILAASVQLVAFKQDIRTVLPALEDVAGAMGQTLPVAAQAFTDAMAGRFQMMKRDLGISKEQLVAFGLEMNKAGHITNPESFVTAFLALANSNEFKGGADKLAHTWTGLMSSMHSQWTYFTANLGSGVFTVLEQQLGGLVHFLQDKDTSGKVQQIEEQIGAALGRATVAVVQLGHTLIATLPQAIGVVEALWRRFAPIVGGAWSYATAVIRDAVNWIGGNVVPVIAAVVSFIAGEWHTIAETARVAWALVSGAVASFVNWLGVDVLPKVQLVVGTLAIWWQEHATQVKDAFTTITDDLQIALTYIATQAGNVMTFLAGVFQVGWGFVEIIWGAAMALLSGDWSKFGADFDNGTKDIMKGLVNAMAGILGYVATFFTGLIGMGSTLMLPLADALMGPWTALARGVRVVWDDLGKMLVAMAGAFALFGATIDKPIVDGINRILKATGDVLAKLPGFLHFGITDAQIKGMQQGAAFGNLDPHQAQAAALAEATSWWAGLPKPGIGPNDVIQAGVSQQQAARDIMARQKAIIDPVLADFERRRKELIAEYHLDTKDTPGKGHQYAGAQAVGKGMLDRLDALIKDFLVGGLGGLAGGKKIDIGALFGLGGGALTWDKLLKQLGITLGTGPGMPDVPDLQVKGPPGTADAALAAGTAGALAKTYVFPASQNLGQLAASFGSANITPGGADHAAERIRQLERANTELHRQNAGLQAELAQRGTEESLLRQLAHSGDLSRGSLDTLARRILPPRGGRSPQPILGPV